MRRIKRLLSFAMAGALMLCTTLTEAFASSSPNSVNTQAEATSNASNSNKAAPKAISSKAEESAKKKESTKKKDSTEKKEKTEKKESSEKKESAEKKDKSEKKENPEKKEKSEKEVRLSLSIASPDGLSKADGAYQVDPEQVKALKFAWSCKGDCDSYEVSVSGGVYSDSTRKTSFKLSVGSLSAGKYTVTVKAIRDGKTVAKKKLVFKVVKSEKKTDDASAEAAPAEPATSDAQETPEADIVQAEQDTEAASTDDAEQDQQEPEAAPTDDAEQDSQEPEAASVDDAAQDSQGPETAPTDDNDAQDQQAPENAPTDDDAQDQQEPETAPTDDAEQDQQEPETAPTDDAAQDPQEPETAPTDDAAQDSQEPEAAPTDDAEQDSQEPEAAPTNDAEQDSQGPETAPTDDAEQDSQEFEAAPTDDAEQDQQVPETAPVDEAEQDPQEPEEAPINDAEQDSQEPEAASTDDAVQEQQEAEVAPADGNAQDSQEPDATQDVQVVSVEEVAPDAQVTPDMPEEMTVPDAQVTPDIPEEMTVLDAQVTPDIPEETTVLDAQTTPGIPEETTIVDAQVTPDMPEETTVLDAQVTPDAPEETTVLDAQDALDLSEQESVPDDSVTLDVPDEIVGPETTDGLQLSNGDETQETHLTLSITGMQGLSIVDGAYRIDPTQASALKLSWTCDGDCDGYRVKVSHGAYNAKTNKTNLSLPLEGLADGSYTATVTALKGEKTAAKASLSFEIASPEAEPGESAELSMTVAAPQGLNITDGAYQVDPTQVDALTLAWEYGDDCDAFRVSVSGGVYSDTIRETSLTLPLDGLAAGRYTAAVSAIVNDVEAAQVQLAFEIVQPEEADELTLSITDPQGLSPVNGVYDIDPAKVKSLTFSWQCKAECDRYQVDVSGGVYSAETTDTSLTLALDKLAAGQYTLSVSAIKDDKAVAQAQLTFKISDGQQSGDQPPTDGMPKGGMPKGGMPKGGMTQGGAAEAEQGFHVTPGEALVSTHTSGSRDMTLYGTVALTLDDGTEMTELTLGGTPLGVMLDGGMKAFTASIDGSTLTLSADDGGTWTLNGRTLKVLSSSGIDVLALHAGGSRFELATARTMRGAVYARLSSEGIVSADYDYQIDDAGIRITVAGGAYRLDDAGALIPMEGDGIAEKMV